MIWVVAVVASVLLLNAFVHLAFALVVLRLFERRVAFDVPPLPAEPGASPVELETKDGLVLRGSHFRREGGSRGLVIFCPELDGSHRSAQTYCRGLLDAGFEVLAFDFRNQGESDALAGFEATHWLTEYEVSDVLAVIRYATNSLEHADHSIGLFGISRGAAAALVAAARTPGIRLVASEGAYSTTSLMVRFTLRLSSMYIPDWSMRPIPLWHLRNTLRMVQWIGGLRRRCRYTNLERWLPRLCNRGVLVIAGEADAYVLPEMSRQLCGRMGPACTLWEVPGAKHNMARQTNPDEYDRRLAEFFGKLEPVAADRKRPQA